MHIHPRKAVFNRRNKDIENPMRAPPPLPADSESPGKKSYPQPPKYPGGPRTRYCGFWVLRNPGGNLGVLGSRQPVDDPFDIKFSGTGGLRTDISTANGWLTTSADYTFPQAIMVWVQLAYSVRGDSYEIVVNSQSVATADYNGGLPLVQGRAPPSGRRCRSAQRTSVAAGRHSTSIRRCP